MAATVVLTFAACGGTPKASYDNAVSEQETCCRQLDDAAARDQCLDGIVRVDDPEVQSSEMNRATYACVAEHFVCDAHTGGPTQESAQRQLDCINDLQE